MLICNKIRCPRHYLVDPTKDAFKREIVPELRKVSESAVKTFGVKKYRIKRDKWGNPEMNWSAMIQPQITEGFAVEHIWDPLNPLCAQCGKGNPRHGRCANALHRSNEFTIKRING